MQVRAQSFRGRVAAFLLARHPRCFCDACIGDHLALTRRQISRATLWLARLAAFARMRARCRGCCITAMVTGARAKCRSG